MQLSKKLLNYQRRNPYLYLTSKQYPINVNEDTFTQKGLWLGNYNAWIAQQLPEYVEPSLTNNINEGECFILSSMGNDEFSILALDLTQLGSELRSLLNFHTQPTEDSMYINSLDLIDSGELRSILKQCPYIPEDYLSINSLDLIDSGSLKNMLIIYNNLTYHTDLLNISGLDIISGTITP